MDGRQQRTLINFIALPGRNAIADSVATAKLAKINRGHEIGRALLLLGRERID